MEEFFHFGEAFYHSGCKEKHVSKLPTEYRFMMLGIYLPIRQLHVPN